MDLLDRISVDQPVTRPAALPRLGSAALVIDKKNRVLLGRRKKEPNYGRWVLPGGKIEPFERIEDAVRREVAEETGLEVEVLEQLGAFEIIDPDKDEHRVIIYSWARPVGGEIAPHSDLAEPTFVTPDQAKTLDITETVRDVLIAANWLRPPLLTISHR